MFNWFKKSKDEVRKLNHPRDLQKGDMLTFKPRSIVPKNLQEQTLTVEQVQAYQYSEGLVPEFVLRTTKGETFTAQIAEEEEGEYLILAKKLSHVQVVSVFKQDEFGEVFGDNFAQVTVNQGAVTEEIAPWIGEKYFQTVKEGVGFFYNEDRREKGVSDYVDDSEELRFHECEGSPDHFSLNIEIWEDGSTDVYAELSLPLNVIEEMWPSSTT